jgi:hypothetical protein
VPVFSTAGGIFINGGERQRDPFITPKGRRHNKRTEK